MGRQQKSFPRSGEAKTPTVLQMEAVECGAAALAIILGYHAKRFVGRIGGAPAACRATAPRRITSSRPRRYGLKSQGLQQAAEDLPLMSLP